MSRLLNALCLTLLILPVSAGDSVDVLGLPKERYSDWPVRTSSRGSVAIAEKLADNEVLVPLLNRDELPVALIASDEIAALLPSAKLTRPEADTSLVEWISKQLDSSKAICWISDSRDDIEVLLKIRKPLQSFVAEGGTVVLIGPHAVAAGSNYSARDDLRRWKLGAGLISDAAICSSTASDSDTFLKALTRRVGIQLGQTGLLYLRARKFAVMGDGQATFRLAKGSWLNAREQVLRPQKSRGQDPNEFIVDLTEWRRDAIERTLEPFPPAKPPTPHVKSGTLYIVGGGGMPKGLMEEIVKAAGGKDAEMVYVPCAEQEEIPRSSLIDLWKRMGVKSAVVLHTKDRVKADTDEEFYKPLKTATGIWFGGGRQWNFADSYYGTTTHRLMKEVLARGGVIGGSSAGASIQARYLARATPIQNFNIMAPGYERGGLGFIGGVAIDQHFSQRGRQKDMTKLVNRYPQMLGIGLDEATAIVVNGSEAKVVGRGRAHFYDRNVPVVEGEPDYVALPAGSKYELATRRVLHDATPPPKEEAAEESADTESVEL